MAALARLGAVAQASADGALALRYFQEALKLVRSQYDRERVLGKIDTQTVQLFLEALNRVAAAAFSQGDWSRADALAEECRRVGRVHLQRDPKDLETMHNVMQALHVIDAVARQNGEQRRAEQAAEEMEALFDSMPSSTGDNLPDSTAFIPTHP
jgi:hypothetical protein